MFSIAPAHKIRLKPGETRRVKGEFRSVGQAKSDMEHSYVKLYSKNPKLSVEEVGSQVINSNLYFNLTNESDEPYSWTELDTPIKASYLDASIPVLEEAQVVHDLVQTAPRYADQCLCQTEGQKIFLLDRNGRNYCGRHEYFEKEESINRFDLFDDEEDNPRRKNICKVKKASLYVSRDHDLDSLIRKMSKLRSQKKLRICMMKVKLVTFPKLAVIKL